MEYIKALWRSGNAQHFVNKHRNKDTQRHSHQYRQNIPEKHCVISGVTVAHEGRNM